MGMGAYVSEKAADVSETVGGMVGDVKKAAEDTFLPEKSDCPPVELPKAPAAPTYTPTVRIGDGKG